MKSTIINSSLRSGNPYVIGIAIGITLMVGVGTAAYHFYKWRKENNQNPVKVDVRVGRETEKAKNILVVGRTGSGKSSLANVFFGEEKFKEVAGSTSGTQENQKGIFKWNGVKYRLFDTIGQGNVSRLSDEELENKLKELFNDNDLRENGISHVFFVFKDRFTKEQIETFEWLKENIPGNELHSCITLVSTNFPEFESKGKCEEDKRKLLELKENENITEIVSNCKLIYVDNPPTDISGNSKRIRNQNSLNKETRKESRKILLDHLESNCKSLLPLSFKIDFSLDSLEEEINNIATNREEQQENQIEVLPKEKI